MWPLSEDVSGTRQGPNHVELTKQDQGRGERGDADGVARFAHDGVDDGHGNAAHDGAEAAHANVGDLACQRCHGAKA
jgi:hypothetical protein